MKFKIALACALLAAPQITYAKNTEKTVSDYPWQQTEKLYSSKDGSKYRMGIFGEGSSYAIYPDGTANLIKADGGWDISCQKDPIDDERKCFVLSRSLRVGVFFGSALEPQFIKIIQHDFPGRRATLRVDQNKAVESDLYGAVPGTQAKQLMTAKSVTTRVYSWPHDIADDKTSTRTGGYSDAVDLLHHIQKNIDKMGFK